MAERHVVPVVEDRRFHRQFNRCDGIDARIVKAVAEARSAPMPEIVAHATSLTLP